MINGGLATVYEVQTVYSVEDVYDMLEIIAVQSHNRRVAERDM